MVIVEDFSFDLPVVSIILLAFKVSADAVLGFVGNAFRLFDAMSIGFAYNPLTPAVNNSAKAVIGTKVKILNFDF